MIETRKSVAARCRQFCRWLPSQKVIHQSEKVAACHSLASDSLRNGTSWTRTGLLDHICYGLCSKHSETLFPQMLPHQIFMQLQPNECNPDGITTEMRRDSMIFERFQMSGLECSVMHQFFGHESGVCEVPSPTQPFTPTVCDFNETFRQKRASLLWDAE
jgi:hypothetical protein